MKRKRSVIRSAPNKALQPTVKPLRGLVPYALRVRGRLELRSSAHNVGVTWLS